MRIAAGISFYQDAKGLKRCLDSIAQHVDFIFAVDGRYKNFNAPDALSTDGSRAVVQEYPNALLVDAPDMMEFEKRDFYMRLCESTDVDVLLIIDSDEFVDNRLTSWDDFRAVLPGLIAGAAETWPGDTAVEIGNRHIFKVAYQDSLHFASKKLMYWPRVVYKPSELQYYKKHYEFIFKPTGLHLKFPASHGRRIAPGLMLGSDYTLRSEEYLDSREDYQEWLVTHEEGMDLRHLLAQQNAIMPIKPDAFCAHGKQEIMPDGKNLKCVYCDATIPLQIR